MTTPARELGRRDEAIIRWHLRRLAAAYPAFSVGSEVLGSKGQRWVAERKDRAVPGTGVVVTASLMELHVALRTDKEGMPCVVTRASRS